MENLEAVWTALDDLALELGQANVVRAMLAQNRQLMQAYADLYRQKAQIAQSPQNPAQSNGHAKPRTATPAS